MSPFPHVPVLLAPVLHALAPAAGARILDGTFGAGGYSAALLEAGAEVIAIDRDPAAQPKAAALAARFPGRLSFIPGCFGDMASLLAPRGIGSLDGVVLDIGVSSPQIDDPSRGFSFRFDGPLDMRMGQDGPSAADLVNGLEEEALADILWRYGEERLSRRIARALVERRRTQPFTRTAELADAIRAVVPKSKDGIDPATRSFQGLRIAVNDELGELERGLNGAEALLGPGGRLAVVSFHSLEDRVVKEFLRQRSGNLPAPSRHLPGPAATGPAPTFRLLDRSGTVADADELATNPRARSARLRSAQRTSAPAWTGSTLTDDSAPPRGEGAAA